MPTLRFTRRSVAALPIPTKATTYWDEALRGLGLVILPSGTKTWILDYRTRAGDRRREKIGREGVLTLEQAREIARDRLADVAKGHDPAAEKAEAKAAKTVEVVSEAWLKHIERMRKPNTLASYQGTMRCHVVPALGPKKAASLTKADVLRVRDMVAQKGEASAKGLKRGATKGKGRGGEAVANKAVVLIRAMFAWAADAGYIPEGMKNPATRVELFREKPRNRLLSAEEMNRLGKALTLAEGPGIPWAQETASRSPSKHSRKPENRVAVFDQHAVAAVRLLALTGARLREILHLRWGEVDLDRGVLRLPDSKSGAKTIFLSGPAVAVLAGLPRLGTYVIASASAGQDDEKPRGDLKRLWRAVCRHAGLNGLVLHHLRHNVGATGAGENLSLHTIGGLLGHRQASTTMRYAAYAADPMHRAADVIASPIAQALGLTANVVDLAA